MLLGAFYRNCSVLTAESKENIEYTTNVSPPLQNLTAFYYCSSLSFAYSTFYFVVYGPATPKPSQPVPVAY